MSKNSPKPVENKSSRGCSIFLWAIVLFIIFSFIFITQNSNDDWKARDAASFNSQMQRDPSTWNKQEQRRFESFSEWNNNN